MNHTIIEIGNVFFGVTFQVSKDSWQEGRLRKQFLQFRNNEFLGMIVIIMLNHDISGWTRGRQPGPTGISGQSSRELPQRFCGNRAFSVRGRFILLNPPNYMNWSQRWSINDRSRVCWRATLSGPEWLSWRSPIQVVPDDVGIGIQRVRLSDHIPMSSARWRAAWGIGHASKHRETID